MSWGRTHNIIYPTGNTNTIVTSEPFNTSGNAFPPIDCCKQLELQIKDIYRRICEIQVPAETPITVINTLSVNLTATGVANHTLSANVNIDPTPGNKLILRSLGLFGSPANFSISFNTLTNNLTLTIDGNTSIVNIPAGHQVGQEDNIYYGTDFATGDTLLDPTLNGKTFRLFWRGLSSFLIPTVEWDYVIGGGFTILLSGFIVDPSDIFFVQFY